MLPKLDGSGMYKFIYSKQSIKDSKNITKLGLGSKIYELLIIIRNNPFQNPPPYEKLKGSSNRYSRKINKQHRLVYEIYEENIIKIDRMWSHYE